MTMLTVNLKDEPAVKQAILAAFPSYRKRSAWVSSFPESGENINSYWAGGSRDEYALIELATLRRRALPTATHPYFDVARHGMANQSNAVIETDRVGNIKLKAIPEGFALVRAGTFCGKAATAHLFLHPANFARYLPAASATA